MATNIAQTHIDATGLACPLPLLKTKQWLAHAIPGEQLLIATTDAGSRRDIPRFISSTHHVLVEERFDPQQCVFIIEAGPRHA
ncbi:sulfurtransferase TusA family protein [Salinispirillum marinum]|uniref:Sulfurtransferase TusA family protein n=2 Tax=Saccharospirillaceae TaxID=255527 RepID=A0ABV8B9J7_9GAMM